MTDRQRAQRNRTLVLSPGELLKYRARLVRLDKAAQIESILNKTICQDAFEAVPLLPRTFVDLLFIDPPYNLTKAWNTVKFKQVGDTDYAEWLDSWLPELVPSLKKTASVYICGDWRSSSAIYKVVSKYFIVRNRITWEREKGRGAKANWKNNCEDVWFCTVSDAYYFNLDAVKLRKRVLAPYKDSAGRPKDWRQGENGKHRLTCPSNIWTDITVPFWSMSENTEHPTQKPEKLVAKIILASSKEGDVILDPFLGSGTTSVVARKLGRQYVGIEVDENYCCLAEKRLELADSDRSIQGYSDGAFWERNSAPVNAKSVERPKHIAGSSLFEELANA